MYPIFERPKIQFDLIVTFLLESKSTVWPIYIYIYVYLKRSFEKLKRNFSFSIHDITKLVKFCACVCVFVCILLHAFIGPILWRVIFPSWVMVWFNFEFGMAGPGTVVCDYMSYSFMFLSVATSNMVATALARQVSFFNSWRALLHLW